MLKKWCIVLCAGLLALLCACRAEPQWETVDDEVVLEVSAMEPRPLWISFGVPQDAVQQTLSDAESRLYVQKTGDYEIQSNVIAASSLDHALRQVSGFGEGELAVLETTRFGLPEYQFGWYSTSDEGNFVSRASMVQDGGYYYALVFSVREGLGTTYDDCADAVFASFGLNADEQF